MKFSSRDSFAQQILKGLSNVAFSFIMVGVLVFTIIAIRYEGPDPWATPDKALEMVLSAVSNATFHADDSVLATGEDFAATSPSAAADGQEAISAAITLESVEEALVEKENTSSFVCSTEGLVNCSDPRLLLAIVAYNLRHFPDLAFFSYGSPVRGSADDECDVSWKFRSRKEGSPRKYRDYRRFSLSVDTADADAAFCNYTVVKASGWHSGKNAKPARKSSGKKKQKQLEPVILEVSSSSSAEELEIIDDAVATTADPESFLHKKYLYYGRGSDHCKPMNHYLWSFLCALGEAIYLNRTMVVDLNLCLSAANNPGHERDEDGKDFRYYFDYAHLKEAASVVEQGQFLEEWRRWNEGHPSQQAMVREVSDYTVTPMELRGEESTVVMRKFEKKQEQENYWYRVCEGETEKVIERPWQMLWKSKRLMDMATAICGKMEWDFDAVHVVRGKRAAEKAMWPNLEADTAAEAVVQKLSGHVDKSRYVYISTEERDPEYFAAIKEVYKNAFSLDDFAELWDANSLWYNETMVLSGGVYAEFDGYMRIEVDTEVTLRAKHKFETFGFLTSDCKDGINTC